MAANIFGFPFKSKVPKSSKNISGNIIAGKIAEGTYDSIIFVFLLNVSFLINAIIQNLVKKVIIPQ